MLDNGIEEIMEYLPNAYQQRAQMLIDNYANNLHIEKLEALKDKSNIADSHKLTKYANLCYLVGYYRDDIVWEMQERITDYNKGVAFKYNLTSPNKLSSEIIDVIYSPQHKSMMISQVPLDIFHVTINP